MRQAFSLVELSIVLIKKTLSLPDLFGQSTKTSMDYPDKPGNDGFSLVELSIVLVILGLLVGGILTGQSLIRAAELRAVTTEYSQYQTAVMTFRDKYFALPGDMTNATEFWGAMTNCGAASPSGTGTQTCSGNGDGQLGQASAANRTSERFGFWQQLANAGLVEGSYSGISGSGNADTALVGVNAPTSKLSSAGWHAFYVGDKTDAATSYFAGSYGNSLMIGIEQPSGGPDGPTLTPEEQWNIDKKIDDGLPQTGKVRSLEYRTNCYDGTEYDLDSQAAQCVPLFITGF